MSTFRYTKDNIIGMVIKWSNTYRISNIIDGVVHLYNITEDREHGSYRELKDFLRDLNNNQIGGTIVSEPQVNFEIWN